MKIVIKLKNFKGMESAKEAANLFSEISELCDNYSIFEDIDMK